MSAPSEVKAGFWAPAKRILDALLATAQNRIELFAVELHEEKCRLVEAMLCAALVAALGLVALTLLTFTIVVFFWEDGRLAALSILSAAYLLGTFFAWRALQSRLNSKTPFSSSISELKKDRACLEREN